MKNISYDYKKIRILYFDTKHNPKKIINHFKGFAKKFIGDIGFFNLINEWRTTTKIDDEVTERYVIELVGDWMINNNELLEKYIHN